MTFQTTDLPYESQIQQIANHDTFTRVETGSRAQMKEVKRKIISLRRGKSFHWLSRHYANLIVLLGPFI